MNTQDRLDHATCQPDGMRPCILEPLEERLLLSAASVAVPDFELPGAGASPAASAGVVGLTPATVRHAYGFDAVTFGSIIGSGAGQTIAIVDAYDTPGIVSDLHAFDVAFGLPDPPHFTKVGQTGGPLLPLADRTGSWSVETSLDVEWAHAAAPAADIVLVEANCASMADLMAAVDTARSYPGVSVVSMSWGGAEFALENGYNSHFTTPAGHAGVTFVASSGDSGSFGYLTFKQVVQYPAASPNVLSVGGTRLNVDAGGGYVSEIGWGNGKYSSAYGGAGGGVSKYVKRPAWQKGVVTAGGSKRAVPDVAMLADPASGVAVYDSGDFGAATPWARVGGTSLAAPLWAGVMALVNQGRQARGLSSLDGPTQTLPAIYGLPVSDFHDIAAGNNGYAAQRGFDMVTGRGTPIVNLLAPGLAGAAIAPAAVTPASAAVTISPAVAPSAAGRMGSMAIPLAVRSAVGPAPRGGAPSAERRWGRGRVPTADAQLVLDAASALAVPLTGPVP